MNEQIKTEIQAMKEWCLDNYNKGADTMAECWNDEDFESLFTSCDGQPVTTADAWRRLKNLASVYAERQADARNSAF